MAGNATAVRIGPNATLSTTHLALCTACPAADAWFIAARASASPASAGAYAYIRPQVYFTAVLPTSTFIPGGTTHYPCKGLIDFTHAKQRQIQEYGKDFKCKSTCVQPGKFWH